MLALYHISLRIRAAKIRYDDDNGGDGEVDDDGDGINCNDKFSMCISLQLQRDNSSKDLDKVNHWNEIEVDRDLIFCLMLAFSFPFSNNSFSILIRLCILRPDITIISSIKKPIFRVQLLLRDRFSFLPRAVVTSVFFELSNFQHVTIFKQVIHYLYF